MDRTELIEWLLESGDPVIRYRTATELLDDRRDVHVGKLTGDLLDCPHVQLWLDRVDGVTRYHDSGNHCLENVMGKLLEFGLHAGMRSLDSRVRRFRRWMATAMDRPRGIMRNLNASIVSSGLVRAGYDDDALVKYLRWRLDQLSALIRANGHDLYVDPAPYTDIPKPFRGHALIRPDLTPDGEFTLPCIHDMYAFAAVPDAMRSPATTRKINALVGYILDDAYQGFPYGYGILRAGKRRYFGMGWSIHLPGHRGFGFDDRQAAYFVQRLELMAHFPVATRHPWFAESLDRLDAFRTDTGTWRLPRPYLKEQRVGYWVTGAHMGLQADRRTARSIEVESTFRVLKIRTLAGRLQR